MERFITLKHLTIPQLHDLYHDACRVGKQVVQYDKPLEQEYYEISLPDEVILRNIRGGNQSFIVFYQDIEDFPDSTTIAFRLAEYPYVTVYIDIDSARLDWFAEKYHLDEWWQMEGEKSRYYSFREFYSLEPIKRPAAD